MKDDTGSVRKWFAGLPAVGTVDLTEHDTTRLRRIAIRRRTLGWFLIFAFPSLVAVAVFLLLFNRWFVGRMHETVTSSTLVGIMALAVMTASLVFLLSLPLALFFAREAFHRARLARMAILRGTITRCRGLVDELILDRGAWKRLDAAGLLEGDQIEIDVIEDARLLWRVGAVEVDPWLELRSGTTTETPEYAWIASRWTRPTESDAETVHYNQRRLSESEKRELEDCKPRFGTTRIAFVAALNALAIWRIFELFSNGSTPLEPVLVSGLALWADIEVVRVWIRRHRMSVDLDEGWVALVRLAEHENPEKKGETISFAEFLPESGAEWTVDGAPAPWRRIMQHRNLGSF